MPVLCAVLFLKREESETPGPVILNDCRQTALSVQSAAQPAVLLC